MANTVFMGGRDNSPAMTGLLSGARVFVDRFLANCRSRRRAVEVLSTTSKCRRGRAVVPAIHEHRLNRVGCNRAKAT